MDKNLILAVVFSALFLMVWYHFFQPVPVPPTGTSPRTMESQKSAAPETAPLTTTFAKEKKEDGKIQAAIAKERTIETKNARVVIHSRGAGIKHWWLKENLGKETSNDSDKNWPDIVNHAGQGYLIPQPNGMEIPIEKLPLSTFPELNFEEIKTVKQGKILRSLWRAVLPSGIELEKEYLWEESEKEVAAPFHFFQLFLSFRNPARSPQKIPRLEVGWSGGLGTIETELKENLDKSRAIAYPSPTKEILNFKESGQVKWEYAWAGVDNRYYLFALLPIQEPWDFMQVQKEKKNYPGLALIAKEQTLLPGEKKRYELRGYVGPKGYAQLRHWGMGLEHAVDFGYFGFLGKWALRSLYFLYGWTGNYGWAIILLTCVVQVIVFPLSLKSYKSMAAMKKLQPKLQELQKRYKGEPKRLNEEMLNLYKVSKTNPFGGCLPMLLQIPVFWAFFTMLRDSYELRGAPWIFWIKDLSQQDPYYVLPIVMGAGMFLQQKISGTPGDPMQAKIMMFLPIIFTFMFLTFPSGLVLYWLTNSILSMGTQYWCNKKFSPPATVPAKTPAPTPVPAKK